MASTYATPSCARLIVVVACVVASCLRGASGLPPGVTKDLVLSGINNPVDLEFLPGDGGTRALVVSRAGTIFIADTTQTNVKQTYMDVPNNYMRAEIGLLDVALDPNFKQNGYFYTYYHHSEGYMRISRFTHKENSGGLSSRGDPYSEKVIWKDGDYTPSTHGWHFGGQMSFGPYGRLYLSLGEKYIPTNAQTQRMNGKPSTTGCVLRLHASGAKPTDNTLGNAVGVPECWVNGLRNGWRMAWDLQTDRLFIGEVGGNDPKDATEDIQVRIGLWQFTTDELKPSDLVPTSRHIK